MQASAAAHARAGRRRSFVARHVGQLAAAMVSRRPRVKSTNQLGAGGPTKRGAPYK